MPDIPDLWGRVFTAVLAVISTLAGAWITRRMDERRAAKDAVSGAGWRNQVIDRLDAVTEAQHVAMRQQLLHNAEKYIERSWITPEEKQAWYDMYVAYAHLGANGFMESYWQKLQNLPEKSL